MTPISPASKWHADADQIKRKYFQREVSFAAVEDRFLEKQLLSPQGFKGGSFNSQSPRKAAAWNVKSHKKE